MSQVYGSSAGYVTRPETARYALKTTNMLVDIPVCNLHCHSDVQCQAAAAESPYLHWSLLPLEIMALYMQHRQLQLGQIPSQLSAAARIVVLKQHGARQPSRRQAVSGGINDDSTAACWLLQQLHAGAANRTCQVDSNFPSLNLQKLNHLQQSHRHVPWVC